MHNRNNNNMVMQRCAWAVLCQYTIQTIWSRDKVQRLLLLTNIAEDTLLNITKTYIYTRKPLSQQSYICCEWTCELSLYQIITQQCETVAQVRQVVCSLMIFLLSIPTPHWLHSVDYTLLVKQRVKNSRQPKYRGKSENEVDKHKIVKACLLCYRPFQ